MDRGPDDPNGPRIRQSSQSDIRAILKFIGYAATMSASILQA
jgi:hypothetical protein